MCQILYQVVGDLRLTEVSNFTFVATISCCAICDLGVVKKKNVDILSVTWVWSSEPRITFGPLFWAFGYIVVIGHFFGFVGNFEVVGLFCGGFW